MTMPQSPSGSESRGLPSVLALVAMLGRHKALVVGLPIVLALLGYAASHLLPVQFKSTIIVAGSAEAPAALLKSIVDSDEVRERIVKQFDLARRYGTEPGLPTARAYAGRVSGRASREGLLFITAFDGEPEFAARLANTIAAQTIALAHERRLSRTGQALNRLRLQLQEQDRKAAAARQVLEKEGIKDWRDAFQEPDAALVMLAADLQAEINERTSTPNPQQGPSFDSSFLRLQERLLSLQREAVSRSASQRGRTVSLAAVEAAKDIAYAAALGKRLGSRAEVLKGQLDDEIKVAAPAPVPLVKDSPRRSFFAGGGLLAGLVLAVLIAVLRDGRQRAAAA